MVYNLSDAKVEKNSRLYEFRSESVKRPIFTVIKLMSLKVTLHKYETGSRLPVLSIKLVLRIIKLLSKYAIDFLYKLFKCFILMENILINETIHIKNKT